MRSFKSVSFCPTAAHPYAFRLDAIDAVPGSPTSRCNNSKALVLRAETEYEMHSWVEALRSRLPDLQAEGEQIYYLNAMNCCFQLVTPPLSPTTGPPKRPRLGTKVSSVSIASITSESSIASEISSIHDSEHKVLLCARRGIKVAPIQVHRSNKETSHWVPIEEDAPSADEDCDSPTFTLYKERFGL